MSKRINTFIPFGIFFLIYLITVVWYTLLKRQICFHPVQFELFWSYRRWLKGDSRIGIQILANIAMFIPFGFFLSIIQRKKNMICILLSALFFSFMIECLQLRLLRGEFEWDDLLNNSIGALWGYVIYVFICHIFFKHSKTILVLICLIFSAVCFGVYLFGDDNDIDGINDPSKYFCFQIDEARLNENNITITGFALCYGREYSNISIILQSTETDKQIQLETEYGITRQDVNNYFFDGVSDYTKTGFKACGTIDPEDEYKVMIRWPWSVPVSCSVFLTGEKIHYIENNRFIAPNMETEFIEHGTIRAYQPENDCWIYQYQNALYWVAGPDFYFENDNTTYIQYHLWTTQKDNLPQNRLGNEHYWDNISGAFEQYEIEDEDEYGDYRIMMRSLPQSYSITSIATGYYKNNQWRWREYFRPIYDMN